MGDINRVGSRSRSGIDGIKSGIYKKSGTAGGADIHVRTSPAYISFNIIFVLAVLSFKY